MEKVWIEEVWKRYGRGMEEVWKKHAIPISYTFKSQYQPQSNIDTTTTDTTTTDTTIINICLKILTRGT